MKLTAGFFTLLSTVFADPQSPASDSASTAAGQPPLVPTGPYFNLVTSVKNMTADNFGYTNLYVHAYHSAAGYNDAVLLPNRATADKGFMNGTYAEFNLGNWWPYGLRLGIVPYGSWAPVNINAGYGDKGFAINEAARLVRIGSDSGDWMVCDWWRDMPQLFVKNRAAVMPKCCAEVDLIVEYLTESGA